MTFMLGEIIGVGVPKPCVILYTTKKKRMSTKSFNKKSTNRTSFVYWNIHYIPTPNVATKPNRMEMKIEMKTALFADIRLGKYGFCTSCANTACFNCFFFVCLVRLMLLSADFLASQRAQYVCCVCCVLLLFFVLFLHFLCACLLCIEVFIM